MLCNMCSRKLQIQHGEVSVMVPTDRPRTVVLVLFEFCNVLWCRPTDYFSYFVVQLMCYVMHGLFYLSLWEDGPI